MKKVFLYTYTFSFIFLYALCSVTNNAYAEVSGAGITSKEAGKIVDTFTDISIENRKKMKATIDKAINNPGVKAMIEYPFDQNRDFIGTPYVSKNKTSSEDKPTTMEEALQSHEAKSQLRTLQHLNDPENQNRHIRKRTYKQIEKYWEE